MGFEGVDQEVVVEDSENYRAGEENKFNHQSLVMIAIKKCLELGSKDLVEGWWEDKVDKQGNYSRIYHEDSRKAFINAVKNLLSIITCDFDSDAETIITSLLGELESRKMYWLNEEFKWWTKLNQAQKDYYADKGMQVTEGFFNRRLDFDNQYFADETDIYRDILTEINKLTFRLDFYGNKEYSN